MWITKRWLAPVLAVSIAFGDCGGMAALAAESAPAGEMSVSENNTIFHEEPADESDHINHAFISENEPENEESAKAADNTETNSIQAGDAVGETSVKAELPALHIGYIKKGEEFPEPADSEFIYDLPVSFEASDSLVLFAGYSEDAVLEKETEGTLVWSILRGEKGMLPGSVSLVNEEDDWAGFETVPDSPLFTLTENEETESTYYKTAELSAIDSVRADADSYSYYIRAAYYLEAEVSEDTKFYAAATVPFLPQNSADTETSFENLPDDAAETEGGPADSMQDESSVSENAVGVVGKELPDSGLAAEECSPEAPLAETADEAMTAVKMDAKHSPAETLSENALPAQTREEPLSTLSENTARQPVPADSIGVLTLSEEHVTMHSGDRLTVRAEITAAGTETAPEAPAPQISWTSGDTTVATVNAHGTSGTIRAVSTGSARITAVCGDLSAVVRVTVLDNEENEVTDLSGDIWVRGFQRESNAFVYMGQKITQNIRVYHSGTLLKEKTDYTLSYKNNVNAAAWNAAKAPSVTITLKGQYSGSVTLYYTIKPVDIKDINIYRTSDDNNIETVTGTAGYEQAVTYSKNLKIPSPVLSFGGKALKPGKDFTCDYTALPADYKNGDSYDTQKNYQYTVNGIGNFTGSIPIRLVVVRDKKMNFDTASVKLGANQYAYHGTALSKTDVAVETVKLGGQILEKTLYDYEVCTDGISNSYVMVYPTAAGQSAGYRGCKKVPLKLTGDRNIKEAVSGENWKDALPFSQTLLDEEGGIFQQAEGLLTFGTGKEPLKEGTDYTIKYSNAQKAGKAAATFTGIGRYKGTLKKTYGITANTESSHFSIHWKNVTAEDGMLAVNYQKGGAVPDFVLKDQDGNILKNKTDYTVKCTNNKAPGSTMSCEITGKGNYKGYTKTVSLKVKKGDIRQATISIPDMPGTKPDAWKATKATILDVNGKALTPGTDYSKDFTYEYENNGQPPSTGTTISVTVQGIGYYEGYAIQGSYRIYDTSINSLTFVINNKEYTGKEITLTPGSDIHVYASGADAKKEQHEIWETCYEIEGYKNNINAGTAKVTLRGAGQYGGTKTCSFKIQKKAYRASRVKGITLDKTSLSLPLTEQDPGKRTLSATIMSEGSDQISNPTITWASSDSGIVAIEGTPVITDGYADGRPTVTSAIVLTLKKEGSATITATAQDGGKKAQCKVSVTDAPLLLEAGQTIKEEIGKTYQLQIKLTETQSQSKLKWESNNPEAVSVDNNGLLTMKKAGAAMIKAIYTSDGQSFTQQCYAVAVDPNEKLPEGRVLTYEQKPGTTDDTPYINDLLRTWGDKMPDQYDCLYIPAGVYHIDPVPGALGDNDQFGRYKLGGIFVQSGQTLIMSPSALLIAIGNASSNYHVIYAGHQENITITGGQIIGDRREHMGGGGEAGHGISILGCSNIHISNVEISQCWGDGIYLGAEPGEDGTRCSSDITIENCNLHHNRRSNLSITDVTQNVTIRNCQFNYAGGTDPQFGINIEPNDNTGNYRCEHIKIYDSTCKGNAKGSMGIMTRPRITVNDVLLENCTLDGTFFNMTGKNVVLRNTTVKEVSGADVKRE